MGQGLPQLLPSRSQAPIDYDLRVADIIKQSQQPQRVQLPLQNNYLRIQLSSKPINHATTNGVAKSVNSSGIGALLDQVFLGEPVGSNQPSIDLMVFL